MLIILRIVFTGLFMYCVFQARDNARDNLAAGDLMNAFWVGAGVLSAIACAIVWAPYLGAKVADPLTGGLVNTPYEEKRKYLLKFIRWCDKNERRGLARWLCFVEGVREPWLPMAFVLGLKNSKPNSWLEKVYAREVFKFNNTENCITAFRALERHGIDPRPHKSPDINVVLMSLDRASAPEPEKLDVAPAPPPPPVKRDERIQIGKK